MGKRNRGAARRATPRASLEAAPAPGSAPATAASPRAPRHGFSTREAQWLVAIVLLVVVSYFPALQGGFVWDDVIFSENR